MKKTFLGLAAAALFASAGAVQLFDNGPLITAPGGGPGGADASQIETGYNIYGFGYRLAALVIVADDFTVPSGQTWDLQTMTWWTYQTTATTQTVNQIFVQIWNGKPGDPGSSVIAGDRTTNRYVSGVMTNIYRVNALPGDTNRRLQRLTVDMSWVPDLTAGTYWVEVSSEGNTGFSGPWVPPVTPHRANDNAVQSVDGGTTWAQLDGNTTSPPPDIQPQDLPFILEGNVAGGSQTLTATTVSFTPGIIVSGTVQNLNASDDQYLVVRPGIVFSTQQDPLVMNASFTAPQGTASQLQFRHEARANQSNIRQTVFAFNFNTMTYDQLDQRNLPTTDTVVTVNLSPTSNYIGPGNEIRMRVNYRTVGPVFSYPWLVSMDESVVLFTP